MIIADANLLLYAYDSISERQQEARQWLESALSGSEQVGLPWIVLLAFLRVATSPRVYREPLTNREATSVVSTWLESAIVVIPEPTDRHWPILKDLLGAAQIRGAGVSDAHLAALAVEHGATLCTADRDFARFQGLSTRNPLEA